MLVGTDPPRRDPYHALVAETMLQQTQVSRVVEKFVRFIELFPSVRALAEASEQDVLSAWTGLGYYRRARNLHAAARQIVSEFGGQVPQDVGDLRRLKGVGPYTAGAIASIAFARPEPIVDGNVARVLLRIHGRDAAADDPAVRPWLWEQAAGLAHAAGQPGVLNEGLMELGATVCLPAPATPRCELCPVREHCRARLDGRQMSIPRAKVRAVRTRVVCVSARVTRSDGATLIEQRPDRGMWASMWQAPTDEHVLAHQHPEPDLDAPRRTLARSLGLEADRLLPDGRFDFLATHRHMTFVVFRARARAKDRPARGEFVPIDRIRSLALSTPQRRVLLGEDEGGLI